MPLTNLKPDPDREYFDRRLTVIFAADLKPSDESETYADELIERTISKDGFFVVYGDSNSGKTFLAIDLSAAVERGVKWMGRHTDPAGVLYLASESPQSVQMRLRAYKKRHGVDLKNLFIVPNPINLFDGTADLDAVIQLVLRVEQEHGIKIGLIIGDTLARLAAGANENAGEDMAVVMRNCDQIKTAAGAAFGLIHHCGKDAARGMRGWSGMRAHVDTEIEVTTDGQGGHAAEITKQRDLDGKGDRIGFRLDVVKIGINQWGAIRTTCVVKSAEAMQKQAKKPKTNGAKEAADKALYSAIETFGEKLPETSTIPAGKLCVSIEQWENYFLTHYGKGKDAKPDSIGRAFRRGMDALIADKAVGISNPYVWRW